MDGTCSLLDGTTLLPCLEVHDSSPLFNDYGVTDQELHEIGEAITGHKIGAMFLCNAAGFVTEHKRFYANRWNLQAVLDNRQQTYDTILPHTVHVVGSEQDPFEPKQLVLARQRLGDQVQITLLPGGHMITSEQADKLAHMVDAMLQVDDQTSQD